MSDFFVNFLFLFGLTAQALIWLMAGVAAVMYADERASAPSPDKRRRMRAQLVVVFVLLALGVVIDAALLVNLWSLP